jgi:hypothetical protein
MRAAEWVDVRPLRRTCAPRGRTTQRPRPPPQPAGSPRRNHRPPLAGVKLVRPRPRPNGRYRCGRQLNPGPRDSPKHGSCEESQHYSRPSDLQVTGADQHALLTAKAPMGGNLDASNTGHRDEEEQAGAGGWQPYPAAAVHARRPGVLTGSECSQAGQCSSARWWNSELIAPIVVQARAGYRDQPLHRDRSPPVHPVRDHLPSHYEATRDGRCAALSSRPTEAGIGLNALASAARIGFAGYALWRLSEAAFGVTGEGNGTGPRLKSLVRALIYAGFACLTFDCAPATMLSRVSPGRRWIPCLSPVVLCRGGREACRTMTSTLSVIPAYAGCPSWRGQVAEEVRPSG